MKRLLTLMLVLALASIAGAQDIREALQQARQDRAQAEREAQQATERILADQARLTAVVDSLESRQAALDAELRRLIAEQDAVRDERDEFADQWSREELSFRELSGNVRVAARDLESLLRGSPLSSAEPERLDEVAAILREGYFPDVDDISTLARIGLGEIRRTGEVSLREGEFGGRDGRDATGEIIHFGRFATVYRTPDELGYLLWNPDSQRLVALPEPPEGGVQGQLSKYLAGNSSMAPVDLSAGPALRMIARKPSIFTQLKQGGPIVYPLGLLALAALVVMIWKAVHIERIHGNTDRIMAAVNTEAEQGRWEKCLELVNDNVCKQSPVARVIRKGLDVRHESREIQESVLQESILHELPVLQRGLALLAISGAVAPLLGLLGTVTGMIETFRVITLFGTGDPKLMSGGISEALVTTEVGLAIAIPVMLAHTWLKRRVDHVIGDMEEQSMHLVNTVDRLQEADRA